MTTQLTTSRHRGSRRGLTVAGVAGGVGTTTIAAALTAADAGVHTRAVDVLVCRATGESVVRAGRAAQLVAAAAGRHPSMAVIELPGRRPGRAVTARLRLLEPHTAAVVLVPFVPRWRDLPEPLAEARTVLYGDEVPRHLRRFAAAMRQLRASLKHRPPVAARPAPAPVSRPQLGRAR